MHSTGKILFAILILSASLPIQSSGSATAAAISGKKEPLIITYVKNRDLDQVKTLHKIKQLLTARAKTKTRTDFDEPNAEGQTALMIAANTGKSLVVIFLLEHLADATKQDKEGRIALDYALNGISKANKKEDQEKYFEIVGAILNQSHNKQDDSLLIQFIDKKDMPHIEQLFTTPIFNHNKPLNINKANAKGQTPLHIAVLGEQKEIVDLLLSQCEINANAQDKMGNTPLHYAAQNGNVEIAIALGNRGALPTTLNNNRQKPAAMIGSKTDSNTKTALISFLNALEKYPVDPKVIKQTCKAPAGTGTACAPQQEKSKRDSKKYEEDALQAFDASTGQTLLTAAAREGNQENVIKLLDIGSKVDAIDKAGDTALIAAIKWYEKPSMRYECPKSCQKHSTENEGFPLPCQCQQVIKSSNHFGAIDTLLKHGAKILFFDKDGKNPLHYAVEFENKPVIQLLLQALQNDENRREIVNSQDKNGDTPLHYAAATSSLEIIKWLLDAQADINVPNKHGKKPIDMVHTKQSVSENTRNNLKKNKKEIIELLSPKQTMTTALSGSKGSPGQLKTIPENEAPATAKK